MGASGPCGPADTFLALPPFGSSHYLTRLPAVEEVRFGWKCGALAAPGCSAGRSATFLS
jgi:hypothetical protein